MQDRRRPRQPLWLFGLWQGALFGIGWGLMMFFLRYREEGMAIGEAAGLMLLSGLMFGASMAWFESRRRRKQDATDGGP